MAQKIARTRLVRRWRRNMDVLDDAEYADVLRVLSEGSVRRNFNPYIDIDWTAPEYAVVDNDPAGSCRRLTRWAGTRGIRRSRRNAKSGSACGVRPMWPRWGCTSSRSSSAA